MSEKEQETEQEKDPLEGVKNQVKTQFRQAFIDLLQQSLESDTPDWNWVKNLYSELRDRICNLTPRRQDRIFSLRAAHKAVRGPSEIKPTDYDSMGFFSCAENVSVGCFATTIAQRRSPLGAEIRLQSRESRACSKRCALHTSRLRPLFWTLAALLSGAIEFLDSTGKRMYYVEQQGRAVRGLPNH